MQSTTLLQQVLDVLAQKGYTDEQLTRFCEDLAKAGFVEIFTQAVGLFSDEEIESIEQSATQEEANVKIKELYKAKTGNDPEKKMQDYYDKFAQGFLEENNGALTS